MHTGTGAAADAWRLVQAFLSGAYKKDLNRDNPLGMQGEMAEAFGTLMQLLWRVRLLTVGLVLA